MKQIIVYCIIFFVIICSFSLFSYLIAKNRADNIAMESEWASSLKGQLVILVMPFFSVLGIQGEYADVMTGATFDRCDFRGKVLKKVEIVTDKKQKQAG
ncbi:MAG: hypothetical protein R2941_07375 [Desulfobacterales bacterium]